MSYMNRYWSQTVRNIKPYTPGEQPRDRKYIKLNTNENPYPPSPKALAAIRLSADETLRLYPDPTCDELRATIAGYHNLGKEQIFIGNGSDELLAFSFPAFFEPRAKPVLFAEVTYSFYPVYAAFFNTNYRLIPVDEEFNIPTEGYFQDNGGIVIANPNAPTGRGIALEKIEAILRHNEKSVVIVDEAYVDFGGESALALIADYPNLLIIKTLSKSHSLAGLRVGYAMGNEGLIEGIVRVKDSINSYTVDRLALAGAREAIRDDAYFQETRARIMKTRERVTARLAEMGFQVIPSEANFIFVSNRQCPGAVLFRQLREKGILVRYFNKPRIENFIRVSIGTDAEMDSFLEAIALICR
jgi:histidinol-phosphate aminotransferase